MWSAGAGTLPANPEEVETAEHSAAAGPDGGEVLGRYRLKRRLGSGGFGTVWLAHDTKLDRAVAVKRIGISDPDVGKRAQREARAAARLSHPGIVALYEAGQTAEAVFLVSELVRGRTLGVLMEEGLLSDRDVVLHGIGLCDALAHAHGRGVVHRDVKPANVLVPDDGGPAKLTDFGIAQLLGDDGLTRTGDVVGTLAYMAPEQAEGRPVTAAADLYALGLVLFEALSGINPVRGRTPASTARRVGTRLPELGRLRRDLPLDLCAAVDAAVAPHPEQRGTLKDLRAALRAARAEVDDEPGTVEAGALEPLTKMGRIAARAAGPERSAEDDEPGRRRALGRRLPAALAGGALVAAGLAGLGPDPPLAPAPGGLAAAAAVAVLPRAGWMACAFALVAWLAAARSDAAGGLALLVALAAGPVPLLLRRAAPVAWSAPALAPVLGLAGLAPAFCALAGQAAAWRARAALGALGAWWLLLAEPLSGRVLLLGPSPGTPGDTGPARGSAQAAAEDVLAPLLSHGALALAAVWALAAVVLPWVVRGRSAGADLLGAALWAAGLAATAAAVAAALPWDGGPPAIRNLVGSAVLAGILAVLARAVRAS